MWERVIGCTLLVSGLALAPPALAQSQVKTNPLPVQSTTTGTTITATNTFQQIWPSAAALTRGRAGCVIANNGANKMFVYLGAPTAASTPKSIPLAAGATWNCNWGGIVVQDEISITGTVNDPFMGAQQ